MNKGTIMKIYKVVIVVSLFLIAFSLILFSNPETLILGYVFGVLISMLTLKLLDNTINKAIMMSPSKANGYITFHYFLRYIIYFVVLSVAAMADYLNFMATAIGLLMVKYAIYISTLLDRSLIKYK